VDRRYHRMLEARQRLDANPEAMRQRGETVEHPFGTMKGRIGATHTRRIRGKTASPSKKDIRPSNPHVRLVHEPTSRLALAQ
jgi:hypothetical protein